MKITKKQFQQLQRANKVNSSTSLQRILAIDPGYGRCGWAILVKPVKSKARSSTGSDRPESVEGRNPKHETNSNVQNYNDKNKKQFKKLKNLDLDYCFEYRDSNFEIELRDCGLIETEKRKNLPDRLTEIYKAVEYLIKKYKPTELAIESLFWFKNQKTAMNVSQARGVIIVCAKNHKLGVSEYTPLQVKQAVVGYGKATKDQIQKMVKFHLPCGHFSKQDDTTDAIAIGLTHLQTNKY